MAEDSSSSCPRRDAVLCVPAPDIASPWDIRRSLTGGPRATGPYVSPSRLPYFEVVGAVPAPLV